MDESVDGALTQTIFRAGNEALLENADRSLETIPFLCECADERCLGTVRLGRDDYERVRAHPRRFVVLPGHEDRGGEAQRVVARDGGSVVVEREGAAGALAEQHDPRSRTRRTA